MEAAATAEPYAEWRALFDPWLYALHGICFYESDLPPLPTVSDIEAPCIRVLLPRDLLLDTRDWRPLVEAMELMDLLARVDHKAAWYLLLELVQYQAMMTQYGELLFGSSEDPVLPSYDLLIADQLLEVDGPNTLQGLLSMLAINDDSPPTRTPTYEDVRQRLLTQWAEAHPDEVFDREIHGRVKVAIQVDVYSDLDDDDDDQATQMFGAMRDLAYAQANPSTIEFTSRDDGKSPVEISSSSIIRGPMEFESLRINFECFSPVTNAALGYMNEIGDCGVRISEVALEKMVYEDLDHNIVSRFLRNQLVLSRDRDEKFGIESLTIEVFKFDTSGIQTLCAAIAHSQTLSTLSFQDSMSIGRGPRERDIWWPWLAYALFSLEADHNIRSVSLTMAGLVPSNIHKIRALLSHSNPLAYLYESTSSTSLIENCEACESIASDFPAMLGKLEPSALLRLGHKHQMDGANTGPFTTSELGGVVQIIRSRDEEDFVEILVPGTGVCWTERSALIELKPMTRRSHHPVRHLKLSNVEADSIQSVIDFLQLVGEPIEHLTLDLTTERLDTESIASLVACCPNLKRLHLRSAPIESFAWLEEWCISHPDQLETLCVDCVHSYRNGLQWSSLFQLLSDSTCALTKSVTQLYLNSFTAGDVESVESCLMMLATNTTLHRFEWRSLRHRLLIPYQEHFLFHHGKLLSVEGTALSAREKLALLSVLTPAGSTEPPLKQPKHTQDTMVNCSPVARYELDPDSLRRIMALAADPKRRICIAY